MTNKKVLACVALTAIFWTGAASAQQSSEALPILASGPPTPQTSYEARVMRPRGVHYIDPNVYAYTADFARRFQMPEQWITPDLHGAEAIAFRVMSDYQSCGWGGNPEACRKDEVQCFVDMYFDHHKQPLPWDERMPSVRLDSYFLSSQFLRSVANPLMRRIRHKEDLTRSSPFVDVRTGKGLGWQKSGWTIGWTRTTSYDREIFRGISLVTLSTDCYRPVAEFWLASKGLDPTEIPTSPALHHRVVLPLAWKVRVQELLQAYNQKASAFYRAEGMKAMKSLQDKPMPQVPILPQQ